MSRGVIWGSAVTEAEKMRHLRKFVLTAAAALALFPVTSSRAAVSLMLAGDPGVAAHSGTSTSVVAGGTFKMSVYLVSTSTVSTDQVVGVTYDLTQQPGPTTGAFSITSRDVTTNAGSNPFSDTVTTLGALTAIGNSGTGLNLGALVAFPANTPVPVQNNYPGGTGAFNPALVATYTIAVAPSAFGTYKLSVLYPNAPAGYAYESSPPPNTSINDNPFSTTVLTNPNSLTTDFTINVTPEPSGLFLTGVIGSMLGLRRRRRPLAAGH